MSERAPRPRTSPLHLCMVGLVALNLVFVYLTEVASTTSLIPLLALTVASPMLARFKENRLYRALWNIGVVGVFGLLVRHAMDRDMAYVLEDGLILAVLCQVHLLNNLHEQQRPDLLFINSYLIALITGYITVDMGFAGAFLAYAPFYVIGLQFLSASRSGKPMGAEDSRAVFFDGVKRSGVLIGIAILAFLFWPRDFEREALLAKYIQFEPNQDRAQVTFSETVNLKKTTGTELRREVVLTAELLDGDIQDVPELWRGATLQLAERGSWGGAQGTRGSADPAWELGPGGLSMKREEAIPRAAAVRVVRYSGDTRRLFFPSRAECIKLDTVHRRGRLMPRPDGTAEYSNPGELRYDVSVAGRREGAEALSISRAERQRYVHFRESLYIKSCLGLAEALMGRMGEEASPREVAEGFSLHLAGRYTYRMPGEQGAAGTLHEFLTTDAGGHCEFFASALAIMLRAAEIPSRVVTGYRANRWSGGKLEVTNLDAHAWVEAYLDGEGWVTFDPTPAGEAGASGPGLFARLGTAAQGLWNRVTGFDQEARAKAMAWLKAAPGRAFRAALGRPAVSIGALMVLVASYLAMRARRRRRTPESVRRLEGAMARAGVQQRPGETPRELFGRVKAALPSEASPEAGPLGDLEAAIAFHERDRYAS